MAIQNYCEQLACWQRMNECHLHMQGAPNGRAPSPVSFGEDKKLFTFAFSRPEPKDEKALASFWDGQVKVHISKDLDVENLFDQGAMGCVFKLRNTKTGEASVLKVLFLTKAHVWPNFDPDRGVHLFRNLRHPNICSPTHLLYLTQEKTLSLTPCPTSVLAAVVMPYVEGRTLTCKKREVAERADRLFNFGLLLGETLAELTRRRIEHFDLGTNNVLVNHAWKPILIDFDTASRTATVSTSDYSFLHDCLIQLIQYSRDIKPQAAKFLETYLQEHCRARSRVPPYAPNPELPILPGRMIALMQGCLIHINAISNQTDEAFDQGRLEESIAKGTPALIPAAAPLVVSTTTTVSPSVPNEIQEICNFLSLQGILQSRIHISETLEENQFGEYRTIFVDNMDQQTLFPLLKQIGCLRGREIGGSSDRKGFRIYNK